MLSVWLPIFQLKCCGVNSPDDYKPIFNNGTLPQSCCLILPKDKTCTKIDASQKGCEPVLLDYLTHQSSILAGIAIAVGLIQVIHNIDFL